MSISQNAIESITMLIDYSAELEDQKTKLDMIRSRSKPNYGNEY